MTQRRMAARRTPGQGRPPWVIVPLAAAAVVFIGVPFLALLQRAPWTDLGDLLSDPIVRDALRLSVTTAFAATGIAVLFGIPLAWVLARTRVPRSLRHPRARHPADGAPTRGGRRRAALRVRPSGPVRRPGVRLDRVPVALLHLGCGGGEHVCGDAVPHPDRRVRPARRRTPVTRTLPPRSAPAGG